MMRASMRGHAASPFGPGCRAWARVGGFTPHLGKRRLEQIVLGVRRRRELQELLEELQEHLAGVEGPSYSAAAAANARGGGGCRVHLVEGRLRRGPQPEAPAARAGLQPCRR